MEPAKENVKHIPILSHYSRRRTSVVQIGDTPLGGEFPIRIQTMTNSSTLDTQSVVEQCKRIAYAGSEYIRLTARNKKEAQNLAAIKKELIKEKITTPLIADIHFNPKLAEIAARIVEKVRINPGNYGPQIIDNKDSEFDLGLEKIVPSFISLLNICKEHGTALRIGVNHGSLSNRILNRFGNTPIGMVESVLEFLRICEDENFHQVVLSMKSSNTRIMVEANRLLIKRLEEYGFNYPIHLGVTEAGLGSEGRIKSAVGIGTLLNEGIGDTIRVSLTEDPEVEIPAARKIVFYNSGRGKNNGKNLADTGIQVPGHYSKRNSVEIRNIGDSNPPVVVLEYPNSKKNLHDFLLESDHQYSPGTKKWGKGEQGPDYIYLKDKTPDISLPDSTGFILRYPQWKGIEDVPDNLFPLFTVDEYLSAENGLEGLYFLNIEMTQDQEIALEKILDKKNERQKGAWPVLILSVENDSGYFIQRLFIHKLIQKGVKSPVILSKEYQETDLETLQLKSSCDFGGFFIDALGDGIWLRNQPESFTDKICVTSFGILQSCRSRITRPEYISCPSCGRTTFDLQKVTTRIQRATSHLKGLKIGIMGCIVNGPGEMADADYGYVGTGKGMVTLFKNNKIVQKGVSSDKAVEELIKLIKDSGDWRDP